jgi:putative transposase
MNKITHYNPEIHHRRSIRLKGYDYSCPGAYYITICAKYREHLFGNIENGMMVLNECGMVAQKYWLEIPMHFPNVILDEYVVMPDHIHGIIFIDTTEYVGANVGANNYSPLRTDTTPRMDTMPRMDTAPRMNTTSPRTDTTPSIIKPGTSKTIGSIVRGFKIGITKWFQENTDILSPWQRNYYEHIIRDENELNRIRQYIIDNPENW